MIHLAVITANTAPPPPSLEGRWAIIQHHGGSCSVQRLDTDRTVASSLSSSGAYRHAYNLAAEYDAASLADALNK